jgi:hypothetical protein
VITPVVAASEDLSITLQADRAYVTTWAGGDGQAAWVAGRLIVK